MKILRENGNVFQRNQSTASQIVFVHRILEGVRKKNLHVTCNVNRFRQTIDSIHREKVEQSLLSYDSRIHVLNKKGASLL